MVFHGSLMCVSMKYLGCLMQVSWIRSFKKVSRILLRLFEGPLREFQGFKFEGCVKEALELFR